MRTVRPLVLTYWIDGVVLEVWCEMRGDYRHFRVGRMVRCTPLEARFAGEGRRLREGLASKGRPGASFSAPSPQRNL